jgi:hypothetical protein
VSPYESDLEDSCHTLEDEVERLNREKDTLEHRLNDAEDVLRWVAKLDPEKGWEQAKVYHSTDPGTRDLYPFAWGWANGELRIIVQRARAFLTAGEAVYHRPANLPPEPALVCAAFIHGVSVHARLVGSKVALCGEENVAMVDKPFVPEAAWACKRCVSLSRPANLPVCAQDGMPQDCFGLPCPVCSKPEPDCECAETDEDSVAKWTAKVGE